MSTTREPATAQAAPTLSMLRRFFFPIMVILVCGTIFLSPQIWVGLGFDLDAALPILMFTPPALPLGILLLTVWWLFFSGFSWTVKFGSLALVAIAVAGFIFSLDSVELTSHETGLKPIFHFRWEPSALDRLKEFQEQNAATADELPPVDATIGPEDFASYRGKNRDGIVPHAKLQTEWSTQPPKLLWSRPCGGGYSGIAVAGNIVVTLEQRGKKETVVCYDRATGAERWAYAYDAFRPDTFGSGPRSTPAIHDNRIFTLGAMGDLVCLNTDGKKNWQINILKDSQATNIKWGMSGSPLIVGDLVIAHAGVDPDDPKGAALVAFEQATGKKRWAVGYRRAGYSSPQLVTLGNVPQILLFDGDGLISYDVATQKELWQFPWTTDWDMNSIQPVILGNDRVFISSEVDNGFAMLRVAPPKDADSGWSVKVLWKNKKLAARFANPVSDGKRIFGLHSLGGELRCLNVENGALLWRGDRCGPGQMLLAGNHLLIVTENGIAKIMDKDAPEETKLARHPVLDPTRKTWNTPALAGDQLFVRNQGEIACWKLPMRR